MSSGPFRIVEHVVPCQYIREYPQATSNEQEDVLHLAVKQYIPFDNPNPQRGDVTIIAAHANGFPKELYEPLWEELHARSKSHGFRIRSIWMADVAHQGESSVINEDLLGNDPSWFDHSRDLLHLINVKRHEMPRPLVGVGHSMGGAHIAKLSLLHPRLLHSVILLDPVIYRQSTYDGTRSFHKAGKNVPITTKLSTYRRDIWPSREAAAESFKNSPFYKAWDPRVLDRWIKYGLRELPTAIHPLDETAKNKGEKPVTLTTTLHQEVFTFSRPNYDFNPSQNTPINKFTHPDFDPSLDSYPFYRPEGPLIFSQIQHLRPSVLYISAGKSDLSTPDLRADKLAVTGTGVGGSGGAPAGRVQELFLEDRGHLLAQEVPNECADAAASWFGKELQRFREEEEAFRAQWSRKSKVEKMTIDEEWKKHIDSLCLSSLALYLLCYRIGHS
ncbi:hypothetical protein DTO027B5_7664 [Paecilomyces variotii]|nr:hypothetical protein DTO027B3_5210 [Paecilomyces variotii]KAJ9330573.1 hypothetical protein DTO027B5_7664 [Paecilomyces variotii]KAJ9356892.1 hypothetical protein DTO027B9_3376 [Paecilomyces variotii]